MPLLRSRIEALSHSQFWPLDNEGMQKYWGISVGNIPMRKERECVKIRLSTLIGRLDQLACLFVIESSL